MKEVKLRMKEYDKYKVIKELADHGGNKKRVALKLGLSVRQVNRLIIKYKEKGKSAFIHGNRDKKPTKAFDKTISEDIILLYQNKYQGYNYNHFKDMLEEKENIIVSYNYIYNLMMKNKVYSPRIRKRTVRKIKIEENKKKKEMKDKSLEEIEVIVNHEISLADAHPRQERPKYFGENIEMDGSIHLWFGDKKTCLHLAVDRCTNLIVGAYFDYQETLNGYYNLFYIILKDYGIPAKFTTDNRTVFAYNLLNKQKRTESKDVLTQFGYACKQLGVDIDTTSVAQGKPLIERCNGTFQGRLVNEFKTYNITTIEAANKYLKDEFIPRYNKRFALDHNLFESVFEKTPDDNKINYTLAVLAPRKIDCGNSIKYKNNYYQPYLDNEIKCFAPKTEVLVINAFDGTLLVSIDEQVLDLKKVESHKKTSCFDIVETTNLEKIKTTYKPSANHPWRVSSFKKHQNHSHHEKKYA